MFFVLFCLFYLFNQPSKTWTNRNKNIEILWIIWCYFHLHALQMVYPPCGRGLFPGSERQVSVPVIVCWQVVDCCSVFMFSPHRPTIFTLHCSQISFIAAGVVVVWTYRTTSCLSLLKRLPGTERHVRLMDWHLLRAHSSATNSPAAVWTCSVVSFRLECC